MENVTESAQNPFSVRFSSREIVAGDDRSVPTPALQNHDIRLIKGPLYGLSPL